MYVQNGQSINISSNKSILIRAESEINANQWFRDKTFFLLGCSGGFWQSTDYSSVEAGGADRWKMSTHPRRIFSFWQHIELFA